MKLLAATLSTKPMTCRTGYNAWLARQEHEEEGWMRAANQFNDVADVYASATETNLLQD